MYRREAFTIDSTISTTMNEWMNKALKVRGEERLQNGFLAQ